MVREIDRIHNLEVIHRYSPPIKQPRRSSAGLFLCIDFANGVCLPIFNCASWVLMRFLNGNIGDGWGMFLEELSDIRTQLAEYLRCNG